METEGLLSPETEADVLSSYEEVGPTARVIVGEVARAMSFDRDEYTDRVTDQVVHTARNALFASLLTVHIGTRGEFDDWLERDQYVEFDVETFGSKHVDNVVWHAAPFATRVVAATFQDERDAAIATLRMQAFGRLYRAVVSG